MRRFVCWDHLSLGVLVVVAAGHLNCVPEDESSLPAPGGGIVGSSPILRGEAGSGGTGGAEEVADDVGDDGSDLLSGTCERDGAKRVCKVRNAYGCVEGEQACVAGTWSACLFGASSDDAFDALAPEPGSAS